MGYQRTLVVRRNKSTGEHFADWASGLPLSEYEHIKSYPNSRWGTSKTSVSEAETLANELNTKAGLPAKYKPSVPYVRKKDPVLASIELEKYHAIMAERKGRSAIA
jgi:hypothetical protein